MRILANVIGMRLPARVTKFASRARVEVAFCRKAEAPDRSEIRIGIETQAGYPHPGDNYAGIAIASILGSFDLSAYSHVTLEYDARARGALPARPSFEFKLHSEDMAHIEYVPVESNQQIRLPLSNYADEGVKLNAVTEVVIAANSEKIGAGSTLDLRIRGVSWSGGDPEKR